MDVLLSYTRVAILNSSLTINFNRQYDESVWLALELPES